MATKLQSFSLSLGCHFVILLHLLLMTADLSFGMNKMPPPEAKLYPGFSRHCPKGDSDCQFTAKESVENSLYFKCRENSICFCSRGTAAPADVLVWPVQWEENKCVVGKGGPCGNDEGLEVVCSPNLNCIQGRCRNASDLNKGQLKHLCYDDLDCNTQLGLSCQPPSQNMEIRIKRCLSV